VLEKPARIEKGGMAGVPGEEHGIRSLDAILAHIQLLVRDIV
jgi:hypothetical protein